MFQVFKIKNIRGNLKSGLTVALISIPLSVSLAVSSGANPVMGIITAVWAGFVAAVFGGSNYNIIGPTGALSGIVAAYALSYGADTLPMLTILSGVLIIISYLLKLERYLILIPSSVIHGFTLGVAFVIGLSQLNFMLGLTDMPRHESFAANILELAKHLGSFSPLTLFVSLLFLSALLVIRKIAPRMPGAILLAPFGILLGYFAENHMLPVTFQTLGSRFGDISFRLFNAHRFDLSASMIKASAAVAVIAILETLLSAKVADMMTGTKHSERKEVLGLGLANVFSGLAGGIPATAALARTSLNVKTGATHRASALINVFGIILISIVLLNYFKYIPLAVIGAILAFVAIQMVETEHFEKLWRYERSGFFIALAVAFITVVFDPIFGILTGVMIAMLIFVERISHGHYEIKINSIFNDLDTAKNKKRVLNYIFKGKLCYINSKAHIRRFENGLKDFANIILCFKEVHFADTDGVDALDEIVKIAEKRGQKVFITGVNKRTPALIKKLSKSYAILEAKGRVLKSNEDAMKIINKLS